MEITQQDNNNFCKINMPEEITIDNAAELNQFFNNEVFNLNQDLVLDLSNTNMIDSSGLGLLLRANKKFESINRKFILLGLSDSGKKILKTCKLDKVFLCIDNIKEVDDLLDE